MTTTIGIIALILIQYPLARIVRAHFKQVSEDYRAYRDPN